MIAIPDVGPNDPLTANELSVRQRDHAASARKPLLRSRQIVDRSREGEGLTRARPRNLVFSCPAIVLMRWPMAGLARAWRQSCRRYPRSSTFEWNWRPARTGDPRAAVRVSLSERRQVSARIQRRADAESGRSLDVGRPYRPLGYAATCSAIEGAKRRRKPAPR